MAAPAINNIQTTSSSLTLSYTVPTVTDGRLVVMVGIEDVGNNNPITGVTFGGASLTQDADAVSVLGSNANRMAIWSLASPTSGTDTITISASNERIGIIAFTLSDCGAKTDSDTDVVGGSSATMTTDVTTVGADNIVVSCTNNSTTSGTTNPAGTTSIANVVASGTVRFQSFYEDAATSGLVSTTSALFPVRSAMATVSYAASGGGGGVSGISAFDINKPTFSATGSATLPNPIGSVSFDIDKPLFSSSGSATLPNPIGSLSFDINNPTFSASGAATLPNPTGSVSFDIDKPIFIGAGSATLPNPVGSVSFNVDKPLFSSNGSPTLPNPTGSVSFTINAPTFASTGSATQTGNVGDAAFTVDSPIFSASGTATLPQPIGAVSFAIDSPVFSATGTVSGLVQNYADDAIVTIRYGKNIEVISYGKNIVIVTSGNNIVKL